MTFKLLRYVKYLGPVFFLLGVIYTSLYPERKLLAKPKGPQDSKVVAATPFDDSTTTATAQEEVPLANCRVSFCLELNIFFFSKLIFFLTLGMDGNVIHNGGITRKTTELLSRKCFD